MIHRLKTRIALLTILGAAAAWPQCRLVDNFTSGPHQVTLSTIGSDVDHQTGSMEGGFRTTTYFLHTNPYGRSGKFQISARAGRLLVENGVRVGHRLDVVWGFDSKDNLVPLNLNLTSCSGIRVVFDSIESTIGLNILFFGGGKYTAWSANIGPTGYDPLVIDVPKGSFVSATPPFDWNNVEWIWIIVGSATAAASDDYAMSSVTVY